MKTLLIVFISVCWLFGPSSAQSPFETKLQKQFGKYCGILQETEALEKTRIYNCHGVVWALDENRLYITGFSFQPSLYRPENITFWIGPDKEPSRFADEIIPSENGIYLEPRELSLQTFLVRNNTYKTAKKPSSEQVSSLLSLISAATAKKQQQASNSSAKTTKVNSRSKDTGSKRRSTTKIAKEAAVPEGSPKSGGKTSQVQKSEPHPAAEPPPPTAEPGPHNNRSIDRSEVHLNKDIDLSTETNRSVIGRINQQLIDHRSNRSIDNRSIGDHDLDHESNETYEIDLIVGGGATIKVTRPYARKWKITTTSPLINRDQNVNQIIDILGRGQENGTNTTEGGENVTLATTTKPKTTTTTTTKVIQRVAENKITIRPLAQWYAGAQPIVLELPIDRQLSEFRWLSVWDHTLHYPIATLLLPSGPGFSIPKSTILNGFKPALTKDVRSGSIEIVDTKTIRVHDFHFEGDAPGAWFYVGRSLIPVATGEIVPIYDEEKNTYDCDFLGAYDNKTLTLKLPGDLEATDVFWLSVFCIPYGISFAHVYLPYKDLNVPASMDFQSVPRCRLE